MSLTWIGPGNNKQKKRPYIFLGNVLKYSLSNSQSVIYLRPSH